MTKPEQRLRHDRANRRAARGLFDRHLAQVKADLTARGIGARIKAKVADQGKQALAQGLEVAKESKSIIAGTAATLLLWHLRVPLLKRAKKMLGLVEQDPVQDKSDIRGEPCEE